MGKSWVGTTKATRPAELLAKLLGLNVFPELWPGYHLLPSHCHGNWSPANLPGKEIDDEVLDRFTVRPTANPWELAQPGEIEILVCFARY